MNIAAEYYSKEFSNYNNIETAIQAMRIGAKWPPAEVNLKAEDIRWAPEW